MAAVIHLKVNPSIHDDERMRDSPCHCKKSATRKSQTVCVHLLRGGLGLSRRSYPRPRPALRLRDTDRDRLYPPVVSRAGPLAVALPPPRLGGERDGERLSLGDREPLRRPGPNARPRAEASTADGAGPRAGRPPSLSLPLPATLSKSRPPLRASRSRSRRLLPPPRSSRPYPRDPSSLRSSTSRSLSRS